MSAKTPNRKLAERWIGVLREAGKFATQNDYVACLKRLGMGIDVRRQPDVFALIRVDPRVDARRTRSGGISYAWANGTNRSPTPVEPAPPAAIPSAAECDLVNTELLPEDKVPEYAAIWGQPVSPASLEAMRQDGTGPRWFVVRRSGRVVYRTSDIDDWIDSQRERSMMLLSGDQVEHFLDNYCSPGGQERGAGVSDTQKGGNE